MMTDLPDDRAVNMQQQGNIFVMIFLAIVLIGLLTVALRGYSGGREDIAPEKMMINIAQISRNAAEMEQAVRYVLENGASETELRFAPPSGTYDGGTISTTPAFQIFSKQGGNAEYRTIPTELLANTSYTTWGFTATHPVNMIGSDKAELIAYMRGVSADFCLAMDKTLGLSAIPVLGFAFPDSPSVFGNTNHTYGTGNTITVSASKAVPQACAEDSNGDYFYYYVLLAR